MRKIFTMVAIAALCGCARAPEQIAPTYVSPVPYEGWTCQQLSEESDRLKAAYEPLAVEQRRARHGDRVGVLLLAMPISSIKGHNHKEEIGSLKGQMQAVAQVSTEKHCP